MRAVAAPVECLASEGSTGNGNSVVGEMRGQEGDPAAVLLFSLLPRERLQGEEVGRKTNSAQLTPSLPHCFYAVRGGYDWELHRTAH